jgi:hypothetical protein
MVISSSRIDCKHARVEREASIFDNYERSLVCFQVIFESLGQRWLTRVKSLIKMIKFSRRRGLGEFLRRSYSRAAFRGKRPCGVRKDIRLAMSTESLECLKSLGHTTRAMVLEILQWPPF